MTTHRQAHWRGRARASSRGGRLSRPGGDGGGIGAAQEKEGRAGEGEGEVKGDGGEEEEGIAHEDVESNLLRQEIRRLRVCA